ncbi:hypothetical protein, partial [uncultured Tenacibaculum sp.]|uniref:hypothetical protein n=1 Tax=uncultured Tenacibaculum sp. TaxID=174713 RepID=UPI0026241FC2
ACDSDLTVTSSDSSVAGTCPTVFVVTRTYTITDDCGNSTDIQQTINIKDETAPSVTGSLNAIDQEGCEASDAPAAVTTVAGLIALGGVTAITDVCDSDLTVTSS